MAFPDDVLTSDEKVVLHLRPHWKVMILPTLVLLLGAAAVVTALVLEWGGGLYVVAAIVLFFVIWRSFWPWLKWRTTHYVFTNERIIFQFGVFSRDRRDIPLMRVNDHSMSQSFVDRMLGCGMLTIESAGERGQSVLKDIPQVGHVQTKLYELVEHDRDVHSLGEGELRRQPAPAQVADPDATRESETR